MDLKVRLIRKMNDTTILAFHSIAEFIGALDEVFGDRQKSLRFYKRIISEIKLANKTDVEKNVVIFRNFCRLNREAIATKAKLTNPMIKYSNKVFINMENIFKYADKETTQTIWMYLLKISAFVDPESRSKDQLTKSLSVVESSGSDSGNEEKFIKNVFNDIGNQIDPNGSPMEMIKNIMNSNVFTDLVQNMSQGLERGDININGLMSAVQGMVGNVMK